MDWFSAFVVLALGYIAWCWYRRNPTVDIHDRAVFVTGCDSGFGNLTAKRLDALGVRVFAACYSQQGAEALAKSTSSKLTTVLCDVTDEASIDAAFNTVSQACPDGLWGLVNNAGIMHVLPAELMPMSSYKAMMAVNFLGLVAVTKRFLPLLKITKGRIINIASMGGRQAFPGITGYCATKFAVEGFSDALRNEVHAFGVRVTMVEPSQSPTPLLKHVAVQARKVYSQAPERVRWQYGEEWLAKFTAQFELGHRLSKWMNPPSQVADAVVDSLSMRMPWHRMQTGWDTIIFFLWMARLPSYLADPVVRLLVCVKMAVQSEAMSKETLLAGAPLSSSSSSSSNSTSPTAAAAKPVAKKESKVEEKVGDEAAATAALEAKLAALERENEQLRSRAAAQSKSVEQALTVAKQATRALDLQREREEQLRAELSKLKTEGTVV